MAAARPFAPVLIVVAGFSRHADALTWGRQRLCEKLGAVVHTSPEFAFVQTRYYEPSMGSGLRKQLWAFERLASPTDLPELKLWTNQLEEQAKTLPGDSQHQFPEQRPLNLDPGYLDLGKFVLATTKDQAHRLALHKGIFAEVTLHYRDGGFRPWPWTYADYQLPEVLQFLDEARTRYRQLRAAQNSSVSAS